MAFKAERARSSKPFIQRGKSGLAKEAAIAKALRRKRAWVLGFQEMKEDCRARKAEGRKVAQRQPCWTTIDVMMHEG